MRGLYREYLMSKYFRSWHFFLLLFFIFLAQFFSFLFYFFIVQRTHEIRTCMWICVVRQAKKKKKIFCAYNKKKFYCVWLYSMRIFSKYCWLWISFLSGSNEGRNKIKNKIVKNRKCLESIYKTTTTNFFLPEMSLSFVL